MERIRSRLRKLIEGYNIDTLQPDVMEVGRMSELVKIAAGSGERYPVVPHACSYHFVVSKPKEYPENPPVGKSGQLVFSDPFLNKPVAHGGKLSLHRTTRLSQNVGFHKPGGSAQPSTTTPTATGQPPS